MVETKLRDVVEELVADLDAIGFDDDEEGVSGAECVDVVSQWMPRLRAVLNEGGR